MKDVLDPHRLEEPPQRRAATRGRSSARRCRRRRSPARRSSPASSASSTARACPTARPRRSSCGPRTRTVHRQAALREGAVVRRRPGRRARSTRATTTRRFPEVVRSAEDAYQQAGITDPRAELAHGRGARLLHADRAGAHGGPRLRRAGHGVEGGAGRHVRPRRRAAGEPRRRPEVASATRSAPRGLRMLFECWLQLRGEAGRRARSPDRRGQAARPHPQPRRRARARASASSRSSAPSPTPDLPAPIGVFAVSGVSEVGFPAL